MVSTGGNGTLGINGADAVTTFGGTMTGVVIDYRASRSTWNLTGSSNWPGFSGFGWGQTPLNSSTVNLRAQ